VQFFGEYRHTVDAKGRVIVPARMREALEGDSAYLVKYFDGCVAMFNQPEFERFVEQLKTLQRSNEIARQLYRNLGGGTSIEAVDKQGRIIVPATLREWAGITKDVLIVGSIDHAELWEPTQYAERQRLDQAQLNEQSQHLTF
jgi:MraZ protein